MRCRAVFQYGHAQSGTPTAYTDPGTGITFDTWMDTSGTMTFGFAFPSNALTTDATEFIGILVSSELEPDDSAPR